MKDYLKRVRWDRKKCIITGVVTAVILMMASVCIIVVQLQNRKNKNTNNMDNIIAETVSLNTVQETTAEETTQEQTEETEEETEEETYEVVEESEVEDFFENEISTEDEEALALPARKLTSEFIPYDGKYREITCYGDSMMAGAGSATPGIVNGKDIYGWTSPHTLEKLTNIPTHNLGVSGENSYDITFRAGGIKLYTDRSITISEDRYVTAKLLDDNGNVFTYDDYSGYGFDYDPYPGDMYIGGYLCDVDNAGDGQVSIKLTKGYAAYNSSEKSEIVVYEIETGTLVRNSIKETTISQAEKETESLTERASESQAEETSESPTQQTSESRAEETTEKPSEPPTIGNVTISAGTQAMTRASQERSNKDILILEMGSNGGWANDYQKLILQYDDIIINSNCKYYIIVGDTDDPGTSLADDNQGEFNEDGSYVGIGDTAWEAALREAYGQHFFNTRTYMIQNGLTDCGLSTTTDDLENYKKGNISKQLRYDWTHFNSYGYYAKGIGIYKKGVELGYWS